jgi:hypothetical protein
MAAPTEVELLRQAMQLQTQCLDSLAEAETAQRERWELLRRVIEDAGKQYSAMRLDAVEDRQMDEGAPLWFSVILTVATSFIPFHAVTAGFFETLTEHAEKYMTRKLRMQLKAVSRATRSESVERAIINTKRAADLTVKIKSKELTVAKFLSVYEPEVHHGLVVMAHTLAEEGATHQGKEREPKKREGDTDAPVVAVTQAMHTWIDSMVRAEDIARKQNRKSIRDLFDIATAKDPAKEAKDKEDEAAKKEAEREPRVPLRQPVERLPRTRKDALQELSFFRDELTEHEDPRIAQANDLRDLQLMAEAIIWASTYDFKVERKSNASKLEMPLKEAPLPKGLWNRLIERYIDPDEGKTYKEVGAIGRLGTKQQPDFTNDPKLWGFPPEVRLSHYFSRVLYPKVKNENAEIIQKFRQLRP